MSEERPVATGPKLHDLSYAALDHLLEGAQIVDAAGTYLYVNAVAAQQAHRPAAELIGRRMADLFPGIEETEMYATLLTTLRSGTPAQMENPFRYPDGQMGHFELRFVPVAAGVLILSLDHSLRQASEQLLRNTQRVLATLSQDPDPEAAPEEATTTESAFLRSVNTWRNTFNAISDIVCVIDNARRVVAINKAGSQHLGLPLEAILGQKCHQLFHQDEAPFAACPCDTAQHGAGSTSLTFSRDDKTLEMSAWPLRNPDGEVDGFVHVIKDVTALHETHDRYRTLFETMTQGVVYQDADGQLIALNPAAEEILGASLAELRSDPTIQQRWLTLHADGSPFPRESLPSFQALATGQTVRDVVLGIVDTVTGEQKWLVVTAVPQRHPGQERPYQVHTTLMDITAQRHLEHSLQESERRITTLLDNLAGMAYRCAFNDTFSMEIVSEGCFALTGYPPERILQDRDLSYADLIHPDDRARVLAEVNAGVAQDRHFTMEYRIIDAVGQVKWVWEKGSAVKNDQGHVLALEGFITDVTQRIAAENAHHDMTRRLQRLTQVLQTLAKAHDIKEIVAIVRDTARDLTHAQGTTFVLREGDTCHYVDENAIAPLWRGRRFSLTTCISGWVIEHAQAALVPDIRKDPRIPLELYAATFVKSLALVPIGRRDVAGAIGVYWDHPHDATLDELELLQALADATSVAIANVHSLKALEASEERYRSLIENLDDVVFALDAQGRFLFASSAIAKYGYTPEAIVHTQLQDLIHPDDLSTAERFVSLAAQGHSEAFELRVRHHNGKTHHVRLQLRPVAGSDDDPTIAGLCVDITALKITEASLRQAQRLESVGRLAGGIAHDFNNLLSVIIGFSDFAIANLPPESVAREDIREVRDAGTRAAALTRQLLAFSRKQVLQPKVLNLNDIIQDLHAMLRRLLGEDIESRLALQPDLGCIEADPSQMEQILMNLVINARDAMPHGGKLTINTTNIQLDEAHAALNLAAQPGPYVMLAVTDTGCGMDAATKERIFDPFFSTKEVGKGTGLGLATIYGIVKQSRGSIWVYSEVGHGSTFKVFLPRIDQANHEAHRELTACPNAAGVETILIVEDEEAVRKLAGRILSQSGYQVLLARDTTHAIELAESHADTIHLLLTDVVMPTHSGDTLATLLCQRLPTLKVLFMSGYAEDAIVHHGVLSPDTHFIGKPFSAAQLTQMVRRVLDQDT